MVTSHGHASTEDESLDDTGSDSEEDMEESRRLKWKRCRRHRPPMMEMWAAVRDALRLSLGFALCTLESLPASLPVSLLTCASWRTDSGGSHCERRLRRHADAL